MQCLMHACPAGTDTPTKEIAPATYRGEQRNQKRDCDASACAGKVFATLRAKLAFHGYSLSRSNAADSPVRFHVGRWGMVRKLRDLTAVTAFAVQVEVGDV